MSNLPQKWGYALFHQVADVTDFVANGSFAALKENVTYQTKGYGVLVRLTDWKKNWTGDFVYVTRHAYEFLSKSELIPGDIVISCVGEPGQVFQVPDLGRPMTLGPNSVRIREVPDALDKRFFAYYWKSPQGQEQLAAITTGTTQLKFNKTGLRSSVVCVPPRQEQKRIAEKLDSVLTRVDAVNTRLARVLPILKRFRQSVLNAATSGRLSEDWRAGRSLDWDRPLFADVVVESSTGLVRSTSEQFPLHEGLIPYFKMNCVGEMWGYECVDMPGVNCSAEELKRYELRQGDWLFNTRNSVELVGKSCVWNGPSGVVFNNNLLRVRFQAGINPMWVEIFFRSPKGRDLLAAVKSATTSVAAIYQRSLMGLSMLRPPEDEQTEIVRRVETLFAFADRLEAHLKAAQTATERLTPALLAKAFRGELVPQDPRDEPASELLRRLQQESPSPSTKRGRKSAA